MSMLLMNNMMLLLISMLMMLKTMSVIDNDNGDDVIDEVDKDWAASCGINGDDNFDVDEGYVVVDVGSGEDFDARDVDDSDGNHGD